MSLLRELGDELHHWLLKLQHHKGKKIQKLKTIVRKQHDMKTK